MRSPYRIDEPTIISFSGGRTSGYMLWHILQANDGKIPSWAHVVFCNTGKERAETLDFVQECGDRWGVYINWLEYRWEPGRHYYEKVNHNSASRNGEPFNMVIQARQFLPNPVMRFCSIEMKLRTTQRWAQGDLGWGEWTSIIGLRHDEQRRVKKHLARNEMNKDPWQTSMPLDAARVTKRHVHDFWKAQPFDLALPSVNYSTPAGNCDGCFLKAWPTLFGLIRDGWLDPTWWIETERQALNLEKTDDPKMALFRADRPSYAKTAELVQSQGDMIVGWGDEDLIDCACTD